MRGILLLIAIFVLPACQITPPRPASGCSITAYPLLEESAEHFVDSGGGRTLTDALNHQSQARQSLVAPSRRQVLLLSGGSQHGAFGTGFFAGLPGVDNYDVVTGISTGALQSAPVFLANQPVPKDRKYPDYMENNPTFGGTGLSNVKDLALAYSIDRENRLLQKRPLGYLSLVDKGSLATFTPLRAMLHDLISPGTIADIRAQSKDRLLLVGATSLDDGITYALDLTKLAADSRDDRVAQGCFVDAVLASSTVPPGVPPVTLTIHRLDSNGNPLENKEHHFIDGGARYAVFFDQLSDALKTQGGTKVTPTDIDVLVNGSLHLGLWLHPKTRKPRTTYSIMDIATRALSVLESQARETSVTSAIHAAKPGRFRLAYVSKKNLTIMTDEPGNHPYTVNKVERTCEDWLEHDKRTLKPLEFHPNYMRCLVDYGAKRGASDPWNTR